MNLSQCWLIICSKEYPKVGVFLSANPEGDVGAVGSVQGPQVHSPWGRVPQGAFLYSFDFVTYTRDGLGFQTSSSSLWEALSKS